MKRLIVSGLLAFSVCETVRSELLGQKTVVQLSEQLRPAKPVHTQKQAAAESVAGKHPKHVLTDKEKNATAVFHDPSADFLKH